MAGFIDRVEELLRITGLLQHQFAASIGREKTSFSRWRESGTTDRAALVDISEAYLVSIDSLLALPGTEYLEPSPLLRRGQQIALDALFRVGSLPSDHSGRLILSYQLLAEAVPTLTVEIWARFLRITPDQWRSIETGADYPGRPQLKGAAFLLGWYDLEDAWLRWLQTGETDLLKGPSAEHLALISKMNDQAGIILADSMKARAERLADKAQNAK